MYRCETGAGFIGRVGLRPWRARMTVQRFTVRGTFAKQPSPQGAPLFTRGQDGYHTYRIPALAVTTSGTVLAFCEGHKNGQGDAGDIDLLLKRSTDNGKSWSAQQVIWIDADNTSAILCRCRPRLGTVGCSPPGISARIRNRRSSPEPARTPGVCSCCVRTTTA